MTPAARDAAAITILDQWLDGTPLEAALTGWARASRYAGSKDRAAVRDIVFDAVRKRRSCATLGNAETGRGLLIGMARQQGDSLLGWDGQGYGPSPLSEDEQDLLKQDMPVLSRGERLDCPDWLLPLFDCALGESTDPTLESLQMRAPTFLRMNLGKSSPAQFSKFRASVIADLAADGITATPHPLAKTALLVTGNTRRLKLLDAYLDGRIELQDAASQAISLDFGQSIQQDVSVLDYCAGGGGKALALAAMGLSVTAHDIDLNRMRDIPARAKRAGADITVLSRLPGQGWSAILADAPCSGSGSWRRAPEAKWAFTGERLQELMNTQDKILSETAGLVAQGGVLGYATCSILVEENEDRVKNFLSTHTGWTLTMDRRLGPLDGGDGFYLAILQRD